MVTKANLAPCDLANTPAGQEVQWYEAQWQLCRLLLHNFKEFIYGEQLGALILPYYGR